jgi:predicted  nucleic acid-binding Zn-ribbon protein
MAAMNEDPTRELPGATPFEQRVLAELGALRSEFRSEVGELRSEVGELRREVSELRSEVAEIRIQQVAMAKNIAALDQRVTSMDQRLTSLEERVDSRLKETRPIWEAVQAQLKKLDEKFNLFILDLYDIRSDIALHGKRLEVLERRVLS